MRASGVGDETTEKDGKHEMMGGGREMHASCDKHIDRSRNFY